MEKELQSKIDNSINKVIASLELDQKVDESANSNFKNTQSYENSVIQQSMQIASSTTAVINPLKNTMCCDSTLSSSNVSSQPNEHSKSFSRRNTSQPLLKKSISNAPTTSIKPLILPAPTSDSFSQHSKSNIVSIHSTHTSSSISTPYNCQPSMTMGIATLQPQHFSYQNLANNRYPVIPMSLQNSYNTQQLTLTNGGLGTTVQLMPVMSQTSSNHNMQQNNNNNSNNNNGLNSNQNTARMQPVPLFMTPIIGPHTSMLFQPNMALGNTMQTFNIAHAAATSTGYSTHDFSGSLMPQTALQQQQPIHQQQPHHQQQQPIVRQHSIVFPVETVECQKEVSTFLREEAVHTLPVVRATVAKSTASIVKGVSGGTLSLSGSKVAQKHGIAKERGLIRTQIYRMKQLQEAEEAASVSGATEGGQEAPSQESEDHKSAIMDEAVVVPDDSPERPPSLPPSPAPEAAPKVPSPAPEEPPPQISPPSLNQRFEDLKKSSCSDVGPRAGQKRRLPSPEILGRPSKIEKTQISGSGGLRRSKAEILGGDRGAHKLTAVVRPEQRKMLMHYLDDLIVFESDEPFPTCNKTDFLKNARCSGSLRLSPRKSRLLSDQYHFLGSPPSPLKTSPPLLEPLTVDIPSAAVSLATAPLTAAASSSCDSLDSSQVRPLSVCSRQSVLPPPVLPSPVHKESITARLHAPNHEVAVSPPAPKRPPKRPVSQQPPPVKAVSPVKQQPPQAPPALARPVLEKAGPVSTWTATEVSEFVRATPGCEGYATLFLNHEIDGEALLLLSKDNLIQGALNMKIGPALKLCARIEKRRAIDPD